MAVCLHVTTQSTHPEKSQMPRSWQKIQNVLKIESVRFRYRYLDTGTALLLMIFEKALGSPSRQYRHI